MHNVQKNLNQTGPNNAAHTLLHIQGLFQKIKILISSPTSSRSIQTSSVSRNLGTLMRKAATRAGAMKMERWSRDE